MGTPYYIAPEVLLKSYDQQCDIWSTGVIMYMMMTRRPPFAGDSEVEVMQKILQTEPFFPKSLKNRYSPECIDLLRRMLVKNPEERIDAIGAFTHPWLRNINENHFNENQQQMIQNIESFKVRPT